MARVEWSVRSRRDLHAVVAFVERDSQRYAAIVAERIVRAARSLRLFPRRGRMVPELADTAIRELIVGSYRLVYRVDGERVTILAVIHGSQALAERLTAEP